MSVNLSPIFTGQQFLDSNGNPLQGQIFTYQAGSFSVQQATFSDSTGGTANPNPIPLDAAGRLTVDLWLTVGQQYNLVLKNNAGTIIDYVDNVVGTPVVTGGGGGGGGGGSIWETFPTAPTFLTSNSFSVAGSAIIPFAVRNRVRANLGGSFVYGTVESVTALSTTTVVVLTLDSGALTGALTEVAHSQNTAANQTVDAAGVRFTPSLTYPDVNTVGNKLVSLDTAVQATAAKTDSLRKVWDSAGTGTFTITPSPAISAYSADQVFTVKFTNASTGAATLNVNGVGAIALKQYNTAGSKVDPTIVANQVSDVAYDGAEFVLLDSLPLAQVATPRGMQVFTSNGTFTVPAGVTALKITAIGGGGGGGSSQDIAPPGDPPNIINGGPGGAGAIYFTYLNTTPGTAFTVSVGAGGAGSPGEFQPNGGNGGQSAFGITICTAQGGFGGQGTIPGVNGTSGAGTPYFVYPTFSYGVGGRGGTVLANATAGLAGCVIVEW